MVIAFALVMSTAIVLALYSSTLALRFRTQQAATLMQMGGFIAVLFTPAYVPADLLQGWLHAIATVNPMSYVLAGARQGFLGGVTWAHTWPALLAISGLLLGLGSLAVRGLRRTGR
jgi:oleandomycin transport system permease protein